MRTYEEQLDQSFDDLLVGADAYFMETGKLHSTLADLTRRLEEALFPMPSSAPSRLGATATAA